MQRPRRLSNWNPAADADAEAQLLRGLLSFRDQAVAGGAGVRGLAKPLNTPAATFDVELARDLQTLNLNAVGRSTLRGAAYENDYISEAASPSTPLPTDPAAVVSDLSGDMLFMAADGQLRRTLHWKRQQRSSIAASVASGVTDLRLLGGRLDGDYFFRRISPTVTPTASVDNENENTTVRRRRLAFRKSMQGPRTQRDPEVERLLGSRTPTIVIASKRGGGGGGGGGGSGGRQNVMALRPPPPIMQMSIMSADQRILTEQRHETLRVFDHEGAAEVSSIFEAPLPAEPISRTNSLNSPPESQLVMDSRIDETFKPSRDKPGRKKRRKVTGLEILSNTTDYSRALLTQSPPPPPPPPPASVGDWTKTPESTLTNQLSLRRPVGISEADAAAVLARSTRDPCCLSRNAENQAASWIRSHSMESRGSVISRKEFGLNEQETSDYRHCHSSRQQSFVRQPTKSSTIEVDSATPEKTEIKHSESEQPEDRREFFPVPNQYRIAHELARTADMNAQFETWLRLGRDPDDFFSRRTTTASYSYFPPLPRYDRGLEPLGYSSSRKQPQESGQQATAAPQFNGSVRRQFYSRRLTPAYLAYGGKNPDDYLPLPRVTVKKRTIRLP